MNTRNAMIAIFTLALAAYLYGLLLAPQLPALVPTHWNIHGEVDGWMPARTSLYLLPATIAAFALLLIGLPWLSPRQFTVETFRETFNQLMVIVSGLMAFVHVVSLQAALHPDAESGRFLLSGIFAAFALIGNVLGRVRRNFWMGIRTPWTLASDRVWNATHRLGARLMFTAGLFGAVAVWLGVPPAALFVLLMAALFVPVIYSLWLDKHEEAS